MIDRLVLLLASRPRSGELDGRQRRARRGELHRLHLVSARA
jgi:hypothetical protein